MLPSIALKRWNFPENLDFKGKIVARFLLRSHVLSICNDMRVKHHINHGAIQKWCRLRNGIFHSINLCQSCITASHCIKGGKNSVFRQKVIFRHTCHTCTPCPPLSPPKCVYGPAESIFLISLFLCRYNVSVLGTDLVIKYTYIFSYVSSITKGGSPCNECELRD